VCPKCGTIAPHEAGTPCYFVKCRKCGSPMVRK
jgi:ribosomal protein L40E